MENIGVQFRLNNESNKGRNEGKGKKYAYSGSDTGQKKKSNEKEQQMNSVQATDGIQEQKRPGCG